MSLQKKKIPLLLRLLRMQVENKEEPQLVVLKVHSLNHERERFYFTVSGVWEVLGKPFSKGHRSTQVGGIRKAPFRRRRLCSGSYEKIKVHLGSLWETSLKKQAETRLVAVLILVM